jgi:glucose/arabinose dehydrogenase
VWTIDGLTGDLTRVTWRRFASGLHEPLSLTVRNGELFVFDRNGIWRLRDTDGTARPTAMSCSATRSSRRPRRAGSRDLAQD